MEPIKGEYAKSDVNILDAWLFFESLAKADEVQSALNWFAEKGFEAQFWQASYPYDHWFENEGAIETFCSEQELIEYVHLYGHANYNIEVHGCTEEGNRPFSIKIHGNTAFLTVFDFRIEWTPQEDDRWDTHHELPFYPDFSLHCPE